MKSILFITSCICLFLSCNSGSREKSELKDSPAVKINPPVEDRVITFDWNGDGMLDSIILKGNAKDDGEDESSVGFYDVTIKVSGQKPLSVTSGDTEELMIGSLKDLQDNGFTVKHNKIKSSYIARLSVDSKTRNDIIVMNGYAYASDEPKFYIVKLNAKGDPALVYNKEQPFVSFSDSIGHRLHFIAPYYGFLDISEFYWDTTVNGAYPNGYGMVRNKAGNVVTAYNPDIVYDFGPDSLQINMAESEKYNLQNNKPWAGLYHGTDLIVFYENDKATPEVRKWKEYVDTWNRISR